MTRRCQPPRHCHGSIVSRSAIIASLVVYICLAFLHRHPSLQHAHDEDDDRHDQARMGLAEGLITPRYVSLHGTILRLPFLRLLLCRVLLTSLFHSFPPSRHFAVLDLGSSWSPFCSSLLVALSISIFLSLWFRLSCSFSLRFPTLCIRVHICPLPCRVLPPFVSSLYLSPLSIFPPSPMSSLPLSIFSLSPLPHLFPHLSAHPISPRSPNLSLLFLSLALSFSLLVLLAPLCSLRSLLVLLLDLSRMPTFRGFHHLCVCLVFQLFAHCG